MFRLRTVRAKLLGLVALSIVVTLAMLPVLGWLMQKQLFDEANDRVRNARRAYLLELDDRVKMLDVAATLLANNSDVARAVHDGDASAADAITERFHEQFHSLDVLLLDKDGKKVSRVGCAGGTAMVDAKHVVKDALAGKPAEGISGRGCAGANVRLPTYLVARPVPGGGAVVLGRAFTKERLERTGHKVGLELALVDPKGALVNATNQFPPGAEKVAPLDPMFVKLAGRTYIVEPFTSDKLTTRKGRKFWLVAARDVTHVRAAIYRDLGIALAFVVAAAVLAALVGFRIAGVMSQALRRVSSSLKRLENQEYVKVQGVSTGDELEDLATGFNTMVDGLKERDKLKTTFGKYMTEAVMDHLLGGKVQLGGESLTATILFSDIRSFTSISEKMDAKNLVALLNEYFTEMVDVVMQEDGVVDKYIGDAIMAVFGAPVPKPDDALHAVRAALGMRKALAALNDKLRARGAPELRTGIGVHTGEVVAGNIGSEKRMEYTVIGDAVNLASRLESATKELGVAVLVSEDTYALVKDAVEARAIKEIHVKGREAPVMTYEITAVR